MLLIAQVVLLHSILFLAALATGRFHPPHLTQLTFNTTKTHFNFPWLSVCRDNCAQEAPLFAYFLVRLKLSLTFVCQSSDTNVRLPAASPPQIKGK